MLQFTHSVFWILLLAPTCLLLSLWFYKKSNHGKVKGILVVLRFLGLFLLGVLLLQPVLERVKRTVDKPNLAVLWDVSKSVKQEIKDTLVWKQQISNFNTKLAELQEDYQIDFFSFDKDLRVGEPVNFAGEGSNISEAINQVNTSYHVDELSGIVLLSDGVANQGLNPEYLNTLIHPIYALQLGDTSAQSDVEIAEVRHNKTVYKGNSFPVEVQLNLKELDRVSGVLSLSMDEELIQEKNVTISQQSGRSVFYLSTDKVGNHLFQVKFTHDQADVNLSNNQRFFSIKVIEKKTNVALVYDKPTPDLGAFLQACATFEVISVKPWSLADFYKSKYDNLDAVVLFLSATPSKPSLKSITDKVEKGVSLWLLLRNQNQARVINSLNLIPKISLEERTTKENLVLPLPNKDYVGLQLGEAWSNIDLLSPLKAMLGTPNLASAYKPQFYQQIGNLKTELPLHASFQKGDQKGLVTLAWDWWKLRMSFYQEYQKHEAFDNWVASQLQFLSAKNEADQLRVIIPDYFSNSLPQTIGASLSNANGNPVSNSQISLELDRAGEKLDYTFTSRGNGYSLRLTGLIPGTYTYTARAEVEGKELVKNGTFVVLPGSIEQQQTRANAHIMQSLAAKSNGSYYSWDNRAAAIKELSDRNEPGVLRSSLDFSEVVDWKWLVFAMSCIFGLEWYLRKLNGSI